MALRLAEAEPSTAWRYLCTPTGNELPDVLDHWDRLGELLGRPIEKVEHPGGLFGLIDEFSMLPSHHARWCTRILKIEVALAWYAKNAPCVAYVGLRADEPLRTGVFGSVVPQRFPLREWGWGLNEVNEYLSHRGVSIPKRTDCALCYDQSLSDWWELSVRYPAVFEQGIDLENHLGRTFRSPTRDAWPVSLTDLRAKFRAGAIPRNAAPNGDLFIEEPARCRMCTL